MHGLKMRCYLVLTFSSNKTERTYLDFLALPRLCNVKELTKNYRVIYYLYLLVCNGNYGGN